MNTNLGRGVFITFEGPEGSGKSTQIRMLAERLRNAGREVVQTVEPGGTPIGMQIRRVFLDAKNREMCPTTELLLTFASRAQNVDECILPALAKGQIVLSDRFTDSTLVYQGIGRGLGAEVVYEVDRIACRGLVPDLTLLIDVDTDVGLERARQRNQRTKDVETRIDEHAAGFHRKIREAYHQLAADEPRRVKLVDGGRDAESVAEEVWRVVEAYLK
jgi:dTMP kinase